MNINQFLSALEFREANFNLSEQGAFRLFNGFLEGEGEWIIDLYATTLLIFWYGKRVCDIDLVNQLVSFYRNKIPNLQTVILKERFSEDPQTRRGTIVFGKQPDREIREYGVRYALDLLLNQDASFYLDTRLLRKWLISRMKNCVVLNTFAYTGSLGVACMAGGAKQVLHTDLNRRFLNLAKTSYTLNGFPIQKSDFLSADFFRMITFLKKEERLFDCVILDPPFFSETNAGKVDLVKESYRLINKVRPLVKHDGYLIMINNALFLSGADFMNMLSALGQDGYLQWEESIPVGDDILGNPQAQMKQLPADPFPFNHATKIAVLKVLRKDQL